MPTNVNIQAGQGINIQNDTTAKLITIAGQAASTSQLGVTRLASYSDTILGVASDKAVPASQLRTVLEEMGAIGGQPPKGGDFHTDVITANGTWTAPVDGEYLIIPVGGGGGGYSGAGGGGGSKMYVQSLTKGDVLAVLIGAGGTAGAISGGTDIQAGGGGETSVTLPDGVTKLTAGGGGGGSRNGSIGGSGGGSSGAGSAGSTNAGGKGGGSDGGASSTTQNVGNPGIGSTGGISTSASGTSGGKSVIISEVNPLAGTGGSTVSAGQSGAVYISYFTGQADSGGTIHEELIEVSGTFTVVEDGEHEIWCVGGGGGSGTGGSGGSGGGGGSNLSSVSLESGNVLSVVIGSGGAASSGSLGGTGGGETSVSLRGSTSDTVVVSAGGGGGSAYAGGGGGGGGSSGAGASGGSSGNTVGGAGGGSDGGAGGPNATTVGADGVNCTGGIGGNSGNINGVRYGGVTAIPGSKLLRTGGNGGVTPNAGLPGRVYIRWSKKSSSSLPAVGTIFPIKIDGIPRDFVVVHQGKPSSMYDDSFNNTFTVMMVDLFSSSVWHSTNVNDYANSAVNNYLGSMISLIDVPVQALIKEVKVPYRPGSGTSTAINSGANGLQVKVFLPSLMEVGISGQSYQPADGSVWQYFAGSTNAQRIAYLNGTATTWWTRSPSLSVSSYAWGLDTGGSPDGNYCTDADGVRPCFCMTALP